MGLALAAEAANRALALAPGLAEAYVRRGNLRNLAGDPHGAEEQWRLALALEPGDPLVLSVAASVAAERGHLDEAVALQRRSIEADPLSVVSRYNLLCWLMMSGQLAEARVEMRQLAELDPSLADFPAMHARLLVLEGRFDEALEIAGQLNDPVQRAYTEALAWHGLGRPEASAAALVALIEAAADKDPLRIAETLAYRGETDGAFRWLQAAAIRSARDPWARYSPFLKPLEGDPRWRAWLAGRGERSADPAVRDVG
jgi:tetratricopeptide (TPR) repeat protein